MTILDEYRTEQLPDGDWYVYWMDDYLPDYGPFPDKETAEGAILDIVQQRFGG